MEPQIPDNLNVKRNIQLGTLTVALIFICFRAMMSAVSAERVTAQMVGQVTNLSYPPEASPQAQAATRRIEFNRDIRPILSDKCWVCHGPDAPSRKIKLRLDSEAAALAGLGRGRRAIVPGHIEQSQIVKRITAKDEALRMPPVDSGRALTEREIELLTEWIKQGAAWQQHWSFIAPARPPLPEVKNENWPRNAIDRFVLARLEREGLQPAPEADRATLIRRVSFDLTGLPPTPAEADAFLRDRSPRAYEKVVDRLLASPRYGERMASRWLDAARYADTNGYQRDDERYMWRWRDWVIEAFNQNKPFDQFTVEQLAGDLLPGATLDQRIATGFNRNNRTNSEDGTIPEEYAVEYAIDRVETTATVWLGLTMGCARCHNHKYDPLTQREFYQFFAYFNSIPESGRALNRGNSPPVIHAPTRAQQRRLDQLETEIAAAEKLFARRSSRLPQLQQAWERKLASREMVGQVSNLSYPLAGSPRHWFPTDSLVVHFALDAAEARLRGAAKFTDGRVDRAAEFDGQTKLEAGKLANFDFEDRFTLSAWIYPTSDEGAIITRAVDGSAKDGAEKSAGALIGRGYGLLLHEGRLQFNLIRVWADDAVRVETENKLALNQWHHVAAVYDGTGLASGARIYLDGQPQKLKAHAGQVFREVTADQPLRLGGLDRDALRFHGLIDEVRLYAAALEPEQVAVLADAAALEAIAQSPQRTAAQADKLRWAFLDTAAPPRMQQAWRRLNELKRRGTEMAAKLPTVMVMQELPEPRETFLLKRGAYDAPGERVTRGTPAALPPLRDRDREGAAEAASHSTRLDLARWLVSKEHPLTARVTVNRFWQMLFGTGLVKTTEDFGAQGEWPSHPELLDWLAVEFRDGETERRRDTIRNPQWDVKALLKLMVMSAAYRQSSKPNPQSASSIGRNPQSEDPENRLLARGPRGRLSAEMIRDQALFVSGLLVERRGGPSVKVYQPAGLWNDMVILGLQYEQDRGEQLYRRSLYTFWKRTIAPPFMQTFDAASRETCVVRETRTNTPLQALNLMNDVTYVEAARMLAERMLREGGQNDTARLRFAFREAAARLPNQNEARILLDALRAQRDYFRRHKAEAARLLGTGEKRRDERLDAVELAAHATVASLILNLDEVITKE